ncbi:amino acid adenylation domain-containing protein [Vibrio pectenicida]|uniref:Amino acid adenylation domain-containing protein n=1 Tax=Vibrio pectenicida TaxID=62763 RepID=A0A7Y3ZZF2_9VIBR|nr:amino acid adenylation domain-containing protein [Vibrio pectenicida]
MTTKTHKILQSMGLEELKRLAREKRNNKAQLMEANAPSDKNRKIFPLTDSQKSIWALEQYQKGNKAYNNPLAITCHIDHEFTPDRVQDTLKKMADRHNIFRTKIRNVDNEPCQFVDDKVTMDVGFDDVSSMPDEEKHHWIMQVAKEEGCKSFDLENGPLFRWRMAKTQPSEYVLMLTFHHIISDGWTVSLCFLEFMKTYFGHGNEQAPQFTEYALNQSLYFEQGKYQKGIEYWSDKLSGAEGILDIATDHPRPDTMSFAGSYVSKFLSGDFCQKLQSAAAKQGATTFHLMLAAYKLLLHKYSGQQDIIIGVPFANRLDAKTQDMLGLFMNTLPLRFQLDSHSSLASVVEAAKKESSQAMTHQDVPFNRILEAIDHPRDLAINPLYQAVLSYQVYPHSRGQKGFSYTPLKVDYGVAKLDLNLWVEEDGDGLVCTINYDTALFEHATIERMLDGLNTILSAIVETPDKTIADLSLLTQSEEKKLLERCVTKEQRSLHPIHLHFEHSAEHFPNNIALRCGNRALSYQELNQSANQLAQRLLLEGVSLGEPVAIAMDKSELSVVSILAILKAGGCYLPIDINLPESKIAYILNDAKAKNVIYASKIPQHIESIAQRTSLNWIDLLDEPENDKISQENLFTDPNSERPAYIIYTSGSTGNPKGVCVYHSQLSAYCQSVAPVLAQSEHARYGMFSSFSTDLAHTMLFPALVGRGELVIFTKEMLESPEALADHLKDNPIDCAKITPTHLSALLNVPNAGDILPQSTLVLGGEALPVSIVQKVKTLRPDCRLVNHYGPTECTVGVTTYLLPNDLAQLDAKFVPIGQPLKGNHVLILDANQQLVPSGLAGELCIGGRQIASGYIGESNISQHQFIDHPYLAGERLYRTGDKGRFNSLGDLEYLGRLDRQVKVRGFRVELGEIEKAICEQDYVESAAVIQRHQGQLSQLIAYVSCHPEQTNSDTQSIIKQQVENSLPAYMHPESWLWLESMPMTASGKINYRQLPEESINNECHSAVEPKNDMEVRLQVIYHRVLSRDIVSTETKFLDLGGNSISALKLLIEVNKAFSMAMTLGEFFAHSSIVELAMYIEQYSVSHLGEHSLVLLNKGNPETHSSLILVHPAGGNVMCYDEFTRGLDKSYPVYGIQVSNFSTVAEYNHELSRLAGHYVEQLGKLSQQSELIIGGWSLGGTIAFEMACQIEQFTGNQPKVLVFDQPAPQVNVDDSANMEEHDRLAYFAQKVERFTGTSFNTSGTQLAAMSDIERSDVFLDGFRKAQMVPDNISAEDFQYFLTILQAHMTATDRYQGQSYGGQVVVAEAQDILPGRTRLASEGLGWQKFSKRPLKVVPALGDHISMMNAPYITQLAVCLQEEIL